MLSTKQVLLDRLTQERGTLFHSFAFMPDDELVRRPAVGEWSVKDVLGHVAAWEAVTVNGIAQFMRGEGPVFLIVDDVDAWNAEQALLRRDRTLAEVKDELIATRRELLDLVTALPDEAFERLMPPPDRHRAIPWVLHIIAEHDREHWAGLMAYKEAWIARQRVL